MKRLTKRDENGTAFIVLDENSKEWSVSVDQPSYAHTIECEAVDKLAEYEDAEEQGLLLRLPCKVGTSVYSIAQDCGGDTLDCRSMDCEDCRYLYTYVEKNAFDTWMCDEIGKTIFLTKEEAEKKLAEMRKCK